MNLHKQLSAVMATLERARAQLETLQERATADQLPAPEGRRPARPPRPRARSGPMSTEEARALAMAYELSRMLAELNDLPENGPGSSVEYAWDCADDVIGYLEPNDPQEAATPARRLRLAATEVRR